ncbi:DUF3482 domain-containing protein [Spectribacter hydrogenooxidans]|uniref:DUF3482 domain-containing protein n=1 Tax=Spectribacter hydrogenoxidans TaxID=3075608 RepID=A0ABU3C2W6_9GAMM|nr:DUF3482 domain-containing protein [Salinisphaera sp. W335]MDT0635689.1 DUF3482 domain-containing protein [Salinisphaera sp. W335]
MNVTNRNPLQLAVVGHTNAGKTSLLRTLTRDAGFGEVSERPATTREVARINLGNDPAAAVALFDTPGLEDALGLRSHLGEQLERAVDPVAGIEAFLQGDHAQGRYEQEARVLRQMLQSDAALLVIDSREPMRAKHRDELQLLAACGRPLLPVLNFVADPEADAADWRAQLARQGQHVLAEFDTVVFDARAEDWLFEKLGLMLDAHRYRLTALQAERREQRRATIMAACRVVAELLVDAAALRRTTTTDQDPVPIRTAMRDQLREREQAAVAALLDLFHFELGACQPPALPLIDGTWREDLFDPDHLREFGIRTGSAVAAGGMAGLGVDAMTGGLSLGAATAIGAGLGAAAGATDRLIRPWWGRLRGRQVLTPDVAVLALLAARQQMLVRALLRRGHAATRPLQSEAPGGGWPGTRLRRRVLRCRTHPGWSRLNQSLSGGAPPRVVQGIAEAVEQSLDEVPSGPVSEYRG